MQGTLFSIFLFLHVGGAIMAFGPGFALPIIASMGGREPQHAAFAMRAIHAVGDRLVEPLAVFVGVTGVGLIWASGRNPLAQLWLLAAIVAYLVALGFALFAQRRRTKALIDALVSMPAGPPSGEPSDQARPAGPPPHIAALVRSLQQGGMLLTTLLVLILALMIFKPGAP